MSSIPKITMQIIDITSCIDDVNTEGLDKMRKRDNGGEGDGDGEGNGDDEIPNLYTYKIQSVLSRTNDQIIKIFGRTSDDQSILVNVKGFLPYFYVGFPNGIDNRPVGSETQMQLEMIIGMIRSKVHYSYKAHLVKWEKLYLQPFEQFIGNDHYLYLKLYFRNQPALREYEKMLQGETHFISSQFREPVPYFVGESNVDEVLKFIHQTDIKPASWIEIKNSTKRSDITKTSIMQIEVDAMITNLVSVDRITNSLFKIMIYDLECQSGMGELGDFPIAVKTYQKLAKEFIDLWLSFKSHPLIKDEINLSRTVCTCLKLVFTDYYYPQSINQVITVDNNKPSDEIINDVSKMITEYYILCTDSGVEAICDECLKHVSAQMITQFPAVSDPNIYLQLTRQVFCSLKRLDKFNYFSNTDLSSTVYNYTMTMIKVAFEDYFDSFNFSPISLKDGVCKPTVSQLTRLSPTIIRIIKSDIKYDQKQKELTDFLSEKILVMPRGDPIIQIGFTFIRLGETQPYIKGILVLDTCQEFTNNDLMFDENNSDMSKDEIQKFCLEHKLSVQTQEAVAKYLADRQATVDKAKVYIKSFQRESDMIRAFAKLISAENPDMIGGYNTFGFDDKYLDNRARELGISDYFLSTISRLKKDQSAIKQPAGSDRKTVAGAVLISGLGNAVEKPAEERKGKKRMETDYLEMKGRISFDIYRIVSVTYDFLPEFKLDAVCKHFLKKQKNDVPPHMISILQRGTPHNRSVIARYCIIDCILCNRLLTKLLIINNLIAMSNVALVPIRYLLFRGQTIKGLSLVVKKCTSRGKVVKTLRAAERSKDTDGYEGAIVLDPIIDIYHHPIAVADFNSLYPSSMISENISNDSQVCDPKYDNLPNFHYNTICYDQYEFQAALHKITKVQLKRKDKVKRPEQAVCRYVANVKGILPEIEEELIAARKRAKEKLKEAEKVGDYELAAVWDCMQLALKITGNSIYGITGAPVSPVYNRNVATCITATGRRMIMFSKGYVEDNYQGVTVNITEAKVPYREVLVTKATCIYGDSVTGDTPVLLRHIESGFIRFKTFDELRRWNTCTNELDVEPKMYSTEWNQYQIWSHGGWTRIQNVMKHKPDKKIVRVNTACGLVDATEDHSLVLENLIPIKPNDCVVETTKLLHHGFDIVSTSVFSNCDQPSNLDRPSSLDEKRAVIYGFYFRNGDCDHGKSWHIKVQNSYVCDVLHNYLHDVYDNQCFMIMSSTIVSTEYSGRLVREYQSLFYDTNNDKKVPDCILNISPSIQKFFLMGYCMGNVDNNTFSCVGKIATAGLYYLWQIFGYYAIIQSVNGKSNEFNITVSTQKENADTYVVKSVKQMSYENSIDVYDITTENHMFNVGPGSMIVHNTDSIFIKFDMADPTTKRPIEGMDAVFISMEICSKVTREISCQLKSPQNLVFEKTIYPFLITSKKMYKGNYFEKQNSTEFYEKTMGFTTKKRDSAPIAKVVVNGLTDLLFGDSNVSPDMIKEYIRTQFKKIVNGEYPINYFVRTKKWQGHYANPDQIAHHVLALRQAARDPGNQFQMNDRVPFVHIINPKATLQGDKIETVDFIKKNNLQLDYQHYIGKLLVKPLVKILNPNKRLGITEKWLMDLLKLVYNQQSHTKTMKDIFTIIPAGQRAIAPPLVDSMSSSESDSD